MSLMTDDFKLDKEETSKPKPEVYHPKDGFEVVPLLRGFTEIKKLFSFLPSGVIICGGYARYCASPRYDPELPSDVDIYCETEDLFNSTKETFKILNLTIKHENDISVTYHRAFEGVLAYTPIIQLIKPVKEAKIVAVGKMEDILTNFDFTVVRAGVLNEDSVMVDADFIHDETHKILRLKNIHCPVSSTLRCLKYSKKGYWLKPFEALRLFLDWQNRDDDYRTKLIDFLKKSDDGDELTQEEVDHLEAMMRID